MEGLAAIFIGGGGAGEGPLIAGEEAGHSQLVTAILPHTPGLLCCVGEDWKSLFSSDAHFDY